MPLLLFALLVLPSPLLSHREVFSLEARANVVAEFEGGCAGCDWGRPGHEAAALALSVDGAYSQHVWLARGERGEYRVSLGPLEAGTHSLAFNLDRARSSSRVSQAFVRNVVVRSAAPGSAEELRLAHAPVLMVRPNTLGRFSDLPLLMWTESEPLNNGGLRLRYSVVFSNEDGGTPSDRLMATWGRLTDIEYVLGVELDASGCVVSEQYQGRGHELLPFAGAHEEGRPILYVVTDNNMVADRGTKTVRMALVPMAFDLSGASREAVMDANPWTYAISAQEARREGRVRPDGRPGTGRVPDPRRFATIEACAATQDATIALSLGVRGPDGITRFFDSDAGLPTFRIGRRSTEFPNGCFRGAVALPPDTRPAEIVALRFRAFTRIARKNEPPLKPGSGRAQLQRVNTLFLLGADDQPGPRLFSWHGEAPLVPEGPHLELAIPPIR